MSCLIMVTPAVAQPGSTGILADIALQQEQIDSMRMEISELDSKIRLEEQSLDRNRQELADATALLSEAEERYNGTLALFERRITAIYKLGDDKFYSVVFSSDSFTDALTRLSQLSTISGSDRELVEKTKSESEEVRKLHARVDSLKQTRAGDLDALKLGKSQLQGQVESGLKKLDEAQTELARARAREQEQEALRLAGDESGGFDDYMPLMGAAVVTGQPPAGLQPTGAVLKGIASWYGPGFHGNTTANGERYNQYAFTAAHKSLPFNTWVKVTYNGRAVFVRINDRGPYIAGRIIDLSFASAQAVGLSGIGNVTVEIYR